MSTHPNAILLLTLKPDGLARATYRAILAECGIKDEGEESSNISISGTDYHHKVMEDSYDDGLQIKADEGDIVVFDMVTYGYGERIGWDALEKLKCELSGWAQGICERHKCTPAIFITANYW